ncbi:MAG: NDP-sugar synthase [Myxococcota bacterium]
MLPTWRMIFAAGRGSRLLPLTEHRPKPALPYLGKPLIARAARFGADLPTVFNVFHDADHMERCARSVLGRDAVVSRESELLGTAGGLRAASEHFEGGALVLNGDADFHGAIDGLIDLHHALGAVATMLLVDDGTDDQRRVGVNDGRVVELLGTPAGRARQRYRFTGIQVISREGLRAMPERGCSVRTAYRRWVDEGRAVHAFVAKGGFRDVGTPADYLQGHLDHYDAAQAVHPSARIDPRAKLTRTWVGAGASVGPVKLVDCVVWDGAHAGVSARRTVFADGGFALRVPLPME